MLKIFVILLLSFNSIFCEEISTNYSLKRVKRSQSCGIVKNSESLIDGISYFKKGTYPWMNSLMDARQSPPSYFCGGVLISNRKVLTAAHCIIDKNENRQKLEREVLILFGAHDLQNLFESDRVYKSPQQILIHPDWNPRVASYDADIAVMLLKEEIRFTSTIQPICLWNSDDDLAAVSNGIVIGYNKSEVESIPQQRKVQIMNNEDCFLNDPEFAKISSKRTFCAGSFNGTDSCIGDGGHGLFFEYQNAFYLRGLAIASYSTASSCKTSKYTAFTNVLKFKSWIDDQEDIEEKFKNWIEEREKSTTTITTKRPKLQHKIAYNDSFCGEMGESTGLIYGGHFSNLNQFPWMAIVKLSDGKGTWNHFGSGCLITSQHVVVNSNTVSYPDSMDNYIPVSIERVKIFLGTTKYDDLSESGSMEVGITKIVNHPNAQKVLSSALPLDYVSVVTLDRIIIFTEFIRPVCLWPFGDDLNDVVGRDAYAVGYGEDNSGGDSLTRKHVRLTVTGVDENCESNFSKELTYTNESKLFCVMGNGSEGPCDADDQFYMKIDSKWYLKGIFSLFLGDDDQHTCNATKPILCQDVSPLVPWILSQI